MSMSISALTAGWVSNDSEAEPATPQSERLPFAVTEVSLIATAAAFWAAIFWAVSYAWPTL